MAGKPPPLPLEFSSDRMRLLAPMLTALAYELGRRRVFEKGFKIVRRFKDTAGRERMEYAPGEAIDHKGALIVAKLLNPAEHFNGEEDAIYRGADRKTVGKMRARGDISDE